MEVLNAANVFTVCRQRLRLHYVSFQVCQKLMISSSRRVWSNEQQVPYLIYESNQWIGYDDVQSLTGKVSKIVCLIL
jgi:hypothetical protein